MASSQVATCSVASCTFNGEGKCHAPSITVGDAITPHCDTLLLSESKNGHTERASVGVCKVASCRHNSELTCSAGEVRVGIRTGEVICLTFEPR